MSPRQREAIEGYLYLAPWAIGFLVFVAGPMLDVAVLSFTKYNVMLPPEFVGLRQLRHRPDKGRPVLPGPSLRTFYYAALVVPIGLALSLGVAMLLNRPLRFTTLWRTFFFLPTLTPVVAAALLWRWMLNPDVGVVNYLLAQIGIKGPGWLASTEWAIPSLALIGLWASVGGSRMIIFLADLQSVPAESRSRRDRRRGSVGQVQTRHLTDDQPDDFLQPGPRRDLRSPDVRVGIRRDEWWTCASDLVHLAAHLSERLRQLRYGLRLGAGVDVRHRDPGIHVDSVSDVQAVGVLRRRARPLMATVAQPIQVTTFGRSRARRGMVGAVRFYVLLGALSLISMFPFEWTFISSGKQVSELYQIPPSIWPANPQFIQNYVEIWTRVPFGQWLLNTFFVTVVSLIGTVISASLVGYSFARFRYPGRDLLFMITLGTLMLPVEVQLIPQYLLFKDLGLAGHVSAADRAVLAGWRSLQHLSDAPVHDGYSL